MGFFASTLDLSSANFLNHLKRSKFAVANKKNCLEPNKCPFYPQDILLILIKVNPSYIKTKFNACNSQPQKAY